MSQYQSVVESAVFFAATCWGSSIGASDKQETEQANKGGWFSAGLCSGAPGLGCGEKNLPQHFTPAAQPAGRAAERIQLETPTSTVTGSPSYPLPSQQLPSGPGDETEGPVKIKDSRTVVNTF